jgi:deazaflavin-dependent oxidoreductase (nitroreductase family)
MSTTHPSSLLAAVEPRILRYRPPHARSDLDLPGPRRGAVLGSRLLMIEHIGRKSGARRYVVLEVVDHPAPDTYVIASGFGAKAQWFRNIQANPRVRMYTGSRAPAPATARILTQPEADRALTSSLHSQHRVGGQKRSRRNGVHQSVTNADVHRPRARSTPSASPWSAVPIPESCQPTTSRSRISLSGRKDPTDIQWDPELVNGFGDQRQWNRARRRIGGLQSSQRRISLR